MSAQPCSKCGQIIVFGQTWDKQWVKLTNQHKVYEIVKGNYVKVKEKCLIPHDLVCPALRAPEPATVHEQTELDIGGEPERYP